MCLQDSNRQQHNCSVWPSNYLVPGTSLVNDRAASIQHCIKNNRTYIVCESLYSLSAMHACFNMLLVLAVQQQGCVEDAAVYDGCMCFTPCSLAPSRSCRCASLYRMALYMIWQQVGSYFRQQQTAQHQHRPRMPCPQCVCCCSSCFCIVHHGLNSLP